MSDFSDRILQYIEHIGSNVSTFEKNAGLANGYIRKLKGMPSDKKLSDILDYYSNINKSWLLTGEGNMLLTNTQQGETLNNQQGHNITYNSTMALEQAMTEVAEQRKLVAKSQEQIDRLLSLLEKK